jgi:hypothetical protein
MGTGAFWSPTRKTGGALLCRDPRQQTGAESQAARLIPDNVEHIFTSCGIVE